MTTIAEPQHQDEPDDIAALCAHALTFSSRLAGPLKHVSLRCGSVSVDVDWHEPPATSGTGTAAAESTPDVAGPGPRLVRVRDGGAADPGPGASDRERPVPDDVRDIRAPLVGTFYRAPSPGAEPFVAVGSVVAVGQTIGIVEAMKLLNPITSEVEGRVVEIVPADGDSVEFEQVLVRVAPADAPAKVG